MAVKSTGLSTKGLRSEFFNTLAGVPSVYGDLTTRIESNSNQETYKWLGTVPQMREFGTGRLAKGLRTESYSVENLKYESTIEVDRDEIADDQTGQIMLRIKELAQRAGTHKDYLLSLLLENGSGASALAYDGQPFFSATHESGSSGAQDNELTYAAATGTVPTTAEFKEALKEAIAAMMGFKDDAGQAIGLQPSGLIAVVHPSIFYTAMEAIGASMIANTSNVMMGAAKVLSLPWLSTAASWYLLKTDSFIRPFIFQDREPIEFTAVDQPESEEGFKREKFLYGCRARYRLTYGYWQFCVKSTFT